MSSAIDNRAVHAEPTTRLVKGDLAPEVEYAIGLARAAQRTCAEASSLTKRVRSAEVRLYDDAGREIASGLFMGPASSNAVMSCPPATSSNHKTICGDP